jgi:hypothetical protein
MVRYLMKGLRTLAGVVRKCAERALPWIQDRLVEAAQGLANLLQELHELSQRVLADLIRRWRGETGS